MQVLDVLFVPQFKVQTKGKDLLYSLHTLLQDSQSQSSNLKPEALKKNQQEVGEVVVRIKILHNALTPPGGEAQ